MYCGGKDNFKPICSDDEDDFHDAVTDPDYAQFSVSCPPSKHKRSGSSVSGCRLVFVILAMQFSETCFFYSTRSDGVASSCAGGDEDDFSSDGEGPTLNIVKKREKQATDQVDGSPTGSSNLTPVKQRSACSFSYSRFHEVSSGQELGASSGDRECQTNLTSPSPCGASWRTALARTSPRFPYLSTSQSPFPSCRWKRPSFWQYSF